MKDSNSKAFMVLIDPKDISTPSSTSEFAGIAADAILDDKSITAPIKTIEYKGWLMFEEEPKTTINCNTHTKPFDIAAISEIAPIQQNNCTPISLNNLPFYINTGATIHISPEKSDFLMLKPIAACPVKGIRGSSVAAIGIGDIKLRVAHGTYIILQNALYIPNTTIHLISVSTLAHDNQAIAHFNDASCWITNKSTGAIIAHRTLLSTKNLYSLVLHSIHAEHVLVAQHTPDLQTLHHHLGHANYQTLRERHGQEQDDTRYDPKSSPRRSS